MEPTYLPPGTPILIDGDRPAVVRECYLEGSTSYAFPHVKFDEVEVDRHAADPWVGTRAPRKSSVRAGGR